MREGDLAPDIELATDRGESLRLSSLRGKKVVLYFYPRASTPGCTTEACEFRDISSDLDRRNTIIIGISPDQPAAQQKFKANFDLPFTLLCDVDKSAAEAYGVWKEKNMYGKKVMLLERT
jgi:peroxiredoxin Q/BCP